MKRRIEIHQLSELSDEQRQRFEDWWVISETIALVKYGFPIPYEGKFLPNISQMIELLKDKLSSIHFHGGNVIVSFYHASVKKQFIKDNLCDALWEAVKAIL